MVGNGAPMPDPVLLSDIRRFLEPIWWAIHHSDLIWHRNESMPKVASHAMCRHASAFMMRLMNDASRHRSHDRCCSAGRTHEWCVVAGEADVARLPKVPGYMHDDPMHYVLMEKEGLTIDLTADQFAVDPHVPHRSDRFFRTRPTPCDPGLGGSVRSWTRMDGYVDLVGRMAGGMRNATTALAA